MVFCAPICHRNALAVHHGAVQLAQAREGSLLAAEVNHGQVGGAGGLGAHQLDVLDVGHVVLKQGLQVVLDVRDVAQEQGGALQLGHFGNGVWAGSILQTSRR